MTFDELIEFVLASTGMTRARWEELRIIMQDDAAMNRVMAAEWRAKPRDSDSAVIDYYRESQIWFVNTFNHGYMALLALANRDPGSLSSGGWKQVFRSNLSPGDTVLDYGGGFYNDTAAFALTGYKVVQAEIEGPVTKFLEEFRRHIRMEDKLEVLRVNSSYPLTDMYQGLVCFETLEHMLAPKQFASHLMDHLYPGKPFALSVSFGDPEHAPYHVAHNAPLGRDDNWWRYMEQLGFERLWRDPNSHGEIWRRR